MNTTETVYISGGEVRVIVLKEKLSAYEENVEQISAREPEVRLAPWTPDASIEKLISQVRENTHARKSDSNTQIRIDSGEMQNILSRAEMARAEFLADATTRLIRGVIGFWRRMIPIAGSAAAGK